MQGGTIQTYRDFASTRLLKVPTIYARGEHTFSVGDAPVEIDSGVEWKMPPATINCEVGPSCIVDLSDTIERELSEDIDTGLLGDLVNLIAAIHKWFDEP